MPRAFFSNVAPVKIGGKLPGQIFQLEVDEEGIPTDGYWRKRAGEAAIAPYTQPASNPAPAASPVASDEAPKKPTAAKKGS